jgi:hypothetical protein
VGYEKPGDRLRDIIGAVRILSQSITRNVIRHFSTLIACACAVTDHAAMKTATTPLPTGLKTSELLLRQMRASLHIATRFPKPYQDAGICG